MRLSVLQATLSVSGGGGDLFEYALSIIFDGFAYLFSIMQDFELMTIRGQNVTLFDALFSVMVFWGMMKVFFGDFDINFGDDDD